MKFSPGHSEACLRAAWFQWIGVDWMTSRKGLRHQNYWLFKKNPRKYPELEQAARQMTPKLDKFFLNESREKIALPKNKKKLAMFLNKNIEVFFFWRYVFTRNSPE